MQKLKAKIKKLLGNRHNKNLRIVEMADFNSLLKIFQEEKENICLFRGEPNFYAELESSWLKANSTNKGDIKSMYAQKIDLRNSLAIFEEYLLVIRRNRKYAKMTALEILATLYPRKNVVTPLIDFTSNIRLAFWKALASHTGHHDAILFVLIVKRSEIKDDIDFGDKKLIETSAFESPTQDEWPVNTKTYFVIDCKDWGFAKNVLKITINKKLISEILNDLQNHNIASETLLSNLEGAYQRAVMSTTTNYLLTGYLYAKDHNHHDAIRAFTKAIALDSTSAMAYHSRARSWSFLGDDTKALSDLDKAIELDPSNWKRHFQKASVLALLKKHKEAIKCYDQTLALRNGHNRSHIGKGIAYCKLGDFNMAMLSFNKAIYTNDDAEAYFYRGEMQLYHLKNDDWAIADFTRVLKYVEQTITDWMTAFNLQRRAYYLRGSAKFNRGEHNEALADLDKALEMEPQDFESHCKKGEVLLALNEYAIAIKSFHKAIRIEPNYAIALAKRGTTYLHLKKYREAISDFTRVIKLEPKAAHIYAARGDMFLLLKNPKKALQDYNKALKIEPENKDFYYKKGQALILLNRIDAAFKHFNEDIRHNPDSCEAYLNKAQACMLTERYDEAVEAFNELIRLRPDDPNYYKFRGEVLVHTGQKEAGLRDIAKAKELGLKEPSGPIH